jgi:hypothetical protein
MQWTDMKGMLHDIFAGTNIKIIVYRLQRDPPALNKSPTQSQPFVPLNQNKVQSIATDHPTTSNSAVPHKPNFYQSKPFPSNDQSVQNNKPQQILQTTERPQKSLTPEIQIISTANHPNPTSSSTPTITNNTFSFSSPPILTKITPVVNVPPTDLTHLDIPLPLSHEGNFITPPNGNRVKSPITMQPSGSPQTHMTTRSKNKNLFAGPASLLKET